MTVVHYVRKIKKVFFIEAFANIAVNPLIIHGIKHMIPCFKELDKRISLYYYI